MVFTTSLILSSTRAVVMEGGVYKHETPLSKYETRSQIILKRKNYLIGARARDGINLQNSSSQAYRSVDALREDFATEDLAKG